jgi:hypothetical protein
MKKFFGFGSSTPPPPPTPPSKPPAPPLKPAPAPSPAKGATDEPAAKSPAPEAPSIVGRWKEPNGSDVTQFAADGTVTETPASGETIRGRYSLHGGTLKLNLEGVEELTFPVKLGGNTLEMTDPEGQVTKYERIS